MSWPRPTMPMLALLPTSSQSEFDIKKRERPRIFKDSQSNKNRSPAQSSPPFPLSSHSSFSFFLLFFFCRDLSRAWRFSEALEVGMVGVNTGIISTASAPFGGVKQSGFGREGGSVGMDEYLSTKYMMMAI